MLVTANKLSSMLQLKVKTGTDDSGNDTTATQSYRRVKVNTVDDDIYAVAQAIAALESTPVLSILRSDSYELVDEA